MARVSSIAGFVALLGLVACGEGDACTEGELSCDSTGLILQVCTDGELVTQTDCEAEDLECHADMGTPHCGPAGMGDTGAEM